MLEIVLEISRISHEIQVIKTTKPMLVLIYWTPLVFLSIILCSKVPLVFFYCCFLTPMVLSGSGPCSIIIIFIFLKKFGCKLQYSVIKYSGFCLQVQVLELLMGSISDSLSIKNDKLLVCLNFDWFLCDYVYLIWFVISNYDEYGNFDIFFFPVGF